MTRRTQQRGVALVITLILLAIITFTAITFLVISRSEKGAVSTSTDQAIATLAADTGVERVQAEILSSILATTNAFNYDFKVSTNYYNPAGFTSGDTSVTNVNYTYPNGNPLSAADQQRNIANLFYNPRPPVYIFTNRAQTGTPDFRFYLDLNRNERFDPNGFQPVVGQNGFYVGTNGVETTTLYDPRVPPPSGILSNFVVGDPEWIGVLERPDEPHGPDNRFVARYATVVVPSGKALDLNRIHNQAFANYRDWRDYRRNMGVGTWEMNLAAFLVDLNTNVWAPVDPLDRTRYFYNPLTGNPLDIAGRAFEDANALIRYRYNPDFTKLRPVDELFGGAGGSLAFQSDMIDGYGAGPLLTNVWVSTVDPDAIRGTGVPWPGDDNPQQFFTPGDLFDVRKVGPDFANRLQAVGAPPNQSTYDRYTFYRLLSQLGTDGGVERGDRVNLNYDNKVKRNALGIASATNFYAWEPRDFFVEAADNLLREYQLDHFRRSLGADYARDNNLAINIPVVTNGVFVYTPSINRLLQLAANMYDATTNRSGGGAVDYPTVFRPIVGPPPSPESPAGIYIVDWEEVTTNAVWRRKPLDMFNPSDVGKIQPGENIYGVPWIIGAKKGLPNFNELTVDNLFDLTRKVEIRKPSRTAAPNETNQMYLISVNSAVGVEAWNSYRSQFPETVDVYATNEMDIYITASNSPSALPAAVQAYRSVFGSIRSPAPWVGTGPGEIPARQSFLAAIATNFTVVTNSIFRSDNTFETQLSPAFDRKGRNLFPLPQMRLSFTNKLQVVMVERASGRVLDYVHLRLGGETNLTQLLADPPGSRGYDGMFVTNRVGGNETVATAPPLGVIYQIEASLGNYGTPGSIWRDYGFGQAQGQTAAKEIDKFRSFMLGTRSAYPPYDYSSNLVMQVPFSPSKRIQQTLSWQANDPLVHYTDGDLAQLSIGPGTRPLQLSQTPQTLANIGQLNDRYQPWGGNPDSSAQTGATGRRNFDTRFKDPMMRRSDDWQFPTNKFPNVGWLGRVHRGTPWQTIYMKAGEIERSQGQGGGAGRDWREWTGNANRRDAALTFPQQDWRIFDLFTAALNDNATAGQLSVNQDGLAAWSAVLSGVIALTNTTADDAIQGGPFYVITNEAYVIPPAGIGDTNAAVRRIVEGINSDRARMPNRVFQTVGDILQVEELSIRSPFLNLSGVQQQKGITDAMYERVPQQIMGLLRGNEQPRFVVYSYGQALKPAERSLVTSGPLFGLCTNYQIMAESVTRAVVRVEGAPDNPRVVVESFNVLPPE
jgi:hypothetical protein